MKGELKAGGLALVIQSAYRREIGKCVTLVQLVQPGEHFRGPGGVPCRWREDYAPGWVVTGDVNTGYEGGRSFHGWAVFEPRSLMPIDGDDHQERDQLAKDKPAELTA